MVPDAFKAHCVRRISRAHTIPKTGSLEQIARDGHVYSFRPSLETFKANNGLVPPELVGINLASTFTGFCALHDSQVFSPIETRPFAGSLEQSFLLAYRCVSREMFNKLAMGTVVNSGEYAQFDRGRPLQIQLAVQKFAQAFRIGTLAGVKSIGAHKQSYDDILVNRTYRNVRTYIVEIEGPPPVMCSGGVAPTFDFDGNRLQDVADLSKNYDMLTCSSFYGGRSGAIVFTWLSDSDPQCLRFIRSLGKIEDDNLTDAILRFLFDSFENVHMQPEWWEGLSEESKHAVMIRVLPDIVPEKGERTADCLRPDGITFPRWRIQRRQAVNFTM